MRFAVLSVKKIAVISAIVVVAAFSVFLVADTGAYAVFYGNGFKKLPIYSVKTDEKKIAVSFDCAWGIDYTETLLETMKKENVKCTFFAVEFWTEKYPDMIRKISEEGHEIGTHSATHPHMASLKKSDVIKELETSARAIENVTGKKVELFRPPFGEYNDTVITCAEELGLYPIQWSVDSLDWKDLSASDIYKRVVGGADNGAIVLFHNQGLHTAEALPMIIKELKAQGYQFVPIGELIYKEGYKIAPNGAQIKND